MTDYERRWSIEFPELAFEKLEPLSLGDAKSRSVTTTYLSPTWRVKEVVVGSSKRYYVTKKMPKNPQGFREESTISLTRSEYESFLEQAPQIVGRIKYNRLKVVGGSNFQKYGITELYIDRVLEGPTIVEVIFKDKISMSNFHVLDSMREITMKGSYKYYLAKRGYGSH